MFKIEAVNAKEGDSLLLYYGDDADPKILLIDGGSRGVYGKYLRPRLQQLRDEIGDRVPLQMVMISHVDGDHISGILDMFKELEESNDPVCTVGTLWHNSFDDIIGNEGHELTTAIVDQLKEGQGESFGRSDNVAVAASIRQGRDLRQRAKKLAISTNDPFTGLVIASPETSKPITISKSPMTFTVLGPSMDRVKALQESWDKYLVEKKLNVDEAAAAGLEDDSVPNLSSLMVLAEQGGRTMLLTGDARGDYIVEGLITAKKLPPEAELPILYKGMPRAERKEKKAKLKEAEADENPPSVHFDLLKMPHHGSDRNVSLGFLRRVTADHYLCSADGNHGNPDVPTLEMLAEARGGAEYTLHFTFTADQHLTSSNAEFREALEKVHHWVEKEKPPNCTVNHRASADDLSIALDFSDPV